MSLIEKGLDVEVGHVVDVKDLECDSRSLIVNHVLGNAVDSEHMLYASLSHLLLTNRGHLAAYEEAGDDLLELHVLSLLLELVLHVVVLLTLFHNRFKI